MKNKVEEEIKEMFGRESLQKELYKLDGSIHNKEYKLLYFILEELIKIRKELEER